MIGTTLEFDELVKPEFALLSLVYALTAMPKAICDCDITWACPVSEPIYNSMISRFMIFSTLHCII
jgi:hypothetical protein